MMDEFCLAFHDNSCLQGVIANVGKQSSMKNRSAGKRYFHHFHSGSDFVCVGALLGIDTRSRLLGRVESKPESKYQQPLELSNISYGSPTTNSQHFSAADAVSTARGQSLRADFAVKGTKLSLWIAQTKRTRQHKLP